MTHGTTITHYVLGDLNYTGYYQAGFQENAKEWPYVFRLSRRVPPFLRQREMEGGWARMLFSIALFEVRTAGETFHICIDARDSGVPGRDGEGGYHFPLLRHVRYYFKVNLNAALVREDPRLRPFADKIVPAGPFFGIRPRGGWMGFPRFLPAPEAGWTFQSARRRLRAQYSLPTLETIRNLRGMRKELDLFFVVRYYVQAHHAEHNAFRFEVMRELKRYSGPNLRIGFVSGDGLPAKYTEFRLPPYPLGEYLENLARSRVGVYVRGLHDCVSFKFGQLLALGLPVAGQTLGAPGERFLKHSHFDTQFAHADPAELARAAVALAADGKQSTLLGASNARVFDTAFAPTVVTAEILEKAGLSRSRG